MRLGSGQREPVGSGYGSPKKQLQSGNGRRGGESLKSKTENLGHWYFLRLLRGSTVFFTLQTSESNRTGHKPCLCCLLCRCDLGQATLCEPTSITYKNEQSSHYPQGCCQHLAMWREHGVDQLPVHVGLLPSFPFSYFTCKGTGIRNGRGIRAQSKASLVTEPVPDPTLIATGFFPLFQETSIFI